MEEKEVVKSTKKKNGANKFFEVIAKIVISGCFAMTVAVIFDLITIDKSLQATLFLSTGLSLLSVEKLKKITSQSCDINNRLLKDYGKVIKFSCNLVDGIMKAYSTSEAGSMPESIRKVVDEHEGNPKKDKKTRVNK